MVRRVRGASSRALPPARSRVENDDMMQSTLSVIPVQLLHTSDPSDDSLLPSLQPVHFPEVEFEDCTAQVNLHHILQSSRQTRTETSSTASIMQSDLFSKTDSESEASVIVPGERSKGHSKRKLPTFSKDANNDTKRQRIAIHDNYLLLNTRCRFDVVAGEDPDILIARRINALAEKSSNGSFTVSEHVASLSLLPSRQDWQDREGQLIKYLLAVRDQDGTSVAHLPIVDTDHVDVEKSPHRFSNGAWLKSLAILAEMGLVGHCDAASVALPLMLDASLDVVSGGFPGPYGSHENSFTLELQIKLYISREAAQNSFTVPSAQALDHFDRLVRFGFPFPYEENEFDPQPHGQVNASQIYNALRSSTLPALDILQPHTLNAALFPFQKSSVNFLLGREGRMAVGKSPDGQVLLEDVQGVMAYDGTRELGLFWRQLCHGLFYNSFSGVITSNKATTGINEVQGGILAEEMGLGKTVEIFALTLLNPDVGRSLLPAYFDVDLDVQVWPTKTTLIVAPEVLRQQWLDEAALHAPELRAFNYYGYRQAAQKIPAGSTWADFARQFDLIVVSFDTLRSELVVARKAPNRSRRFERKYERPRSLLIQLAFHRVVMDEVQLVGHSMAAETVSMIARKYSVAVSGTPLKQMSDLQSLFKFLRVPGPLMSKAHYARLLQPALLPILSSVLGILATRHTKAQVQREMILPQQTRTLVPINFTAIESAFYRDIHRRLLSGLNVDPNGFATRTQLVSHVRIAFGDEVVQLRSTLLALRQACTHPQIASSGVRGTALASSQTIRSMDEVLTIMIDGSKAEHDSIWHALVQKRIDRAVLLLQRRDGHDRHDIAKAMLNASLGEIDVRVADLKAYMERAKRFGPLYKFEKSEEGYERREESIDLDGADAVSEIAQDGKIALVANHQTQAERARAHEMEEKRMLRRRHITALQQRLRNFLEQQHRCFHFLGNIHYQLGEKAKAEKKQNDEMPALETTEEASSTVFNGEDAIDEVVARLKKSEEEFYDKAEAVRQELLKDTRKIVDQAIAGSHRQAIDFSLEQLHVREEFGTGGLRSTMQFEMLADLQDKLDSHARVLFDWRQRIWQRLERPVNRTVSDEDENDDQYQENLDAQAEAEALLEMYRVLVSEREYMLTGVQTEGALGVPQVYAQLEREVPQFERALRRNTLQVAAGSNIISGDSQNARWVDQDDWLPSAQEVQVMRQQLDHFRKLEGEKNRVAISRQAQLSAERLRANRRRVRPDPAAPDEQGGEFNDQDMPQMTDLRPFDVILRELREILQNTDVREEVELVRGCMEKLRQFVSRQRQMLEKIRRESASYSVLFNARSTYFKQVQALSDQVADIVTDSIDTKNATLEREEATLKRREELCSGRLRYLKAIEEEEEADTHGEDREDGKHGGSEATTSRAALEKSCPICTETLVRAIVLDTCGHTTCEACFKRWTAQRGQCPMCKTRANLRNIYRVTYSKQGKKRRVQIPEADVKQRQLMRYNVIDETLLQAIQRMPIRSSLGSKLDLLTRHLLYIDKTQPGTKSLIFTAFSRGIALVGDALRLNGVRFVCLDQGGARGGAIIDSFKNDGNVNVLLLHSEAQSSGLNLVCAQNIFLLEPLVNHSLELQAIGRVHRIGQTRPTSVFCYEVNQTVEQQIVELARRRKQSLFTHENSLSSDLKDSAEMAAKVHESKTGKRTVKGGREKDGEFVGQFDDVIECLFPQEELEESHADAKESDGVRRTNGVPQLPPSSSSSTIAAKQEAGELEAGSEEDDMARMRRERLKAIERRQKGSSI